MGPRFVDGALQENAERKGSSLPPSPPSPYGDAFRGAKTLGPTDGIKATFNPREKKNLDRVKTQATRPKKKAFEKPFQSSPPPSMVGDDPDGPPLDYYDAMMEGGDFDEMPADDPVVFEQPEREQVSSESTPDYSNLALSPEYWVTDIEYPDDGNQGRLVLGDYKEIEFGHDNLLGKQLEEVYLTANIYKNAYYKRNREKRKEAEKPVEKMHELIRWPDGENGQRRFAVAVDGKQVPLRVDEQLAEGLIKMQNDGDLKYITAMHSPDDGTAEISHVRTVHFESEIPADEASKMAVAKFFPTTYPEQSAKGSNDLIQEAAELSAIERTIEELEIDPIEGTMAKTTEKRTLLGGELIDQAPAEEPEDFREATRQFDDTAPSADEEPPLDLLDKQAESVEDPEEREIVEPPEEEAFPLPLMGAHRVVEVNDGFVDCGYDMGP